jgi:hypothetical protein
MTLSNYQPSAEQLNRNEALKRFNRLYVIVPVAIAAVIALALIIALTVFAFLPNNVETRRFISGLADIVIILATLPMTLLCAVLPVAYVAIALNRRQQRRLYPQMWPMASGGRIQLFLWWLQSQLDLVQASIESGSTVLANKVMKVHERFQYYSTFGERLRRNFLGDKDDRAN